MPQLFDYPFQPIRNSTAPSFNSTGGDNASTLNAFESSGLREWDKGPDGRAVRFAESSGVDYFVNFGTSDIVAASSDSMFVLGGTVELFRIQPGQTHMALISFSTVAEVNITIGYGR